MLQTTADALLPLMALIGLGAALRRSAFASDGFWAGLNRMNYWVFFPGLLFSSLATADLRNLPALNIAGAIWLSLLACALLMLACRRWIAAGGPAFTSVFQGGIRFNSALALVVVPTLFGPRYAALTAILVASVVPLVNVLCVLALARYAQHRPLGPSALVRPLLTNPFIQFSALSIAWNVLGVPVPAALKTVAASLGQAAYVSALLAVGAGLHFESLAGQRRAVVASSAFKFAALPALTALACAALGVPADLARVMVFFQAMPTATASYVLARQMGGDERLMSAIVTVQSLVAFVVMPLMALALL